jgi:hypothetical protein
MMILDKGICSIFSVGGTVFNPTYTLKYQSWYGELNFESAPSYPTEAREDVEVSARIRVIQDRSINNRDALFFSASTTPSGDRYEVTRTFHGVDEESGQPITDLTLRRVV